MTEFDRSTVSKLVAQLAELGLVREEEAAQRGAGRPGRPSHNVAVTDHMVSLVVHPETDAVTVGCVAMGGRVLRQVRCPTLGSPSAAEVVNMATAIVDGMRNGLDRQHHIIGVAVAVPGRVDRTLGTVLSAPNLGWSDVPLGPMLERALDLEVSIGTDAMAGALAECAFGVGRKAADFVYLHGGESGIRGAIVISGRLLSGSREQAGEFGHTLVRTDGARCRCGRTGCLETEVDRTSLLLAAGLEPERAAELPAVLSDLGRNADGSSLLRQTAREQLQYLLTGVENVVRALDPEAVVLGGFLGPLLASAGDLSRASSGPRSTENAGSRCLPALILDDGALIGAAELVFARLLADPFYRPRNAKVASVESADPYTGSASCT
ncbi:ROK family protein [Herbiconiux liukaitaii]|uniref:ROK family protein n=1 Tax=Herbiconiux liukaitaii TaxID=3342799 RepID=UPI0035BB6EA5